VLPQKPPVRWAMPLRREAQDATVATDAAGYTTSKGYDLDGLVIPNTTVVWNR